jgi:hypothetical protein
MDMKTNCMLFRHLACLLLTSFFIKAQAPEQLYIDQLNRFQGNKLLLVGKWSAMERLEWNRLLENEGIFEFDIRIIETSDKEVQAGTWGVDSPGFERWLHARYALGGSRWLMLDVSNKAQAQGIAVPDAKKFTESLDKAGLINPIKQLRNFLKIHPDHLEARADLLTQLRRRAAKLTAQKMAIPNASGNGSVQPSETFPVKKHLDPEADIIIWGSLAQEVDVAFRGNWHGISIPFFRVEEEHQFEQYSSTMKFVFSRHVAKVETALQEVPNSQSLWNVWGWMARGLENRDWKRLLNSLDAFSYPGGLPCPSPNVAIWLAKEAAGAGDWEKAIELAKIGAHFSGYPGESRVAWFPGGWLEDGSFDRLPGYPTNSAFIPMLEWLLRLNRLEEASAVFEDVLFFGEANKRETMANLAQNLGHADLAQNWRLMVPSTSVPRLNHLGLIGRPTIVRWGFWDMPEALRKIPVTNVQKEEATNIFGWPEDKVRWALLDNNNRMVLEGEGALQEGSILEAVEKMGYRTSDRLARDFLRDHPDNAYAQHVMASALASEAWQKSRTLETLGDDLDFELYGECAKILLAYCGNEIVLKCQIASSPHSFIGSNSNLMGAASERILPKIEEALKQMPTSNNLWNAWLALRRIAGNARPFAPLLAELVPSPLVPADSFPPAKVLNAYYNECVKQERWPEAIKLLRQPWERDLALIDATIDRIGTMARFPQQTWTTGKLLIAALLHNGKPSEAEDVADAWASRGGPFRNVTDIIEHARNLKYNSLVNKWEKMSQ